MTLRIRQVVMAACDLETTVERLEQVFQLQVAYRDPQVAQFGLRNALLPIGDQFLEVVSPTREDTTAGRLLARRGDSGYMLILQTDDFARERARVAAAGVRIVWEATYPDIRAAHLHPKDLGGAIVSLDQPIPPAAWRWAGPDWQKHVSNDGPQRVLAVTIEAQVPRPTAQRWATVLGLASPAREEKGWRLELDGGALRFVGAGVRGEGIAGFTLAVKDVKATLELARSRGLSVERDALTVGGARFELVHAA